MADYSGWIVNEKVVGKVDKYVEVGIATCRGRRVVTLYGPLCNSEGQTDFYSLEEARTLVLALQEAIFLLEKEQLESP